MRKRPFRESEPDEVQRDADGVWRQGDEILRLSMEDSDDESVLLLEAALLSEFVEDSDLGDNEAYEPKRHFKRGHVVKTRQSPRQTRPYEVIVDFLN